MKTISVAVEKTINADYFRNLKTDSDKGFFLEFTRLFIFKRMKAVKKDLTLYNVLVSGSTHIFISVDLDIPGYYTQEDFYILKKYFSIWLEDLYDQATQEYDYTENDCTNFYFLNAIKDFFITESYNDEFLEQKYTCCVSGEKETVKNIAFDLLYEYHYRLARAVTDHYDNGCFLTNVKASDYFEFFTEFDKHLRSDLAMLELAS